MLNLKISLGNIAITTVLCLPIHKYELSLHFFNFLTMFCNSLQMVNKYMKGCPTSLVGKFKSNDDKIHFTPKNCGYNKR